MYRVSQALSVQRATTNSGDRIRLFNLPLNKLRRFATRGNQSCQKFLIFFYTYQGHVWFKWNFYRRHFLTLELTKLLSQQFQNLPPPIIFLVIILGFSSSSTINFFLITTSPNEPIKSKIFLGHPVYVLFYIQVKCWWTTFLIDIV